MEECTLTWILLLLHPSLESQIANHSSLELPLQAQLVRMHIFESEREAEETVVECEVFRVMIYQRWDLVDAWILGSHTPMSKMPHVGLAAVVQVEPSKEPRGK